MAFIDPNSVCVVCGEKLDRPYTATSGVAFPREHRLYKYCDAPLHYDCLETWPDRIEFARGYYESRLQSHRSGLTGHLLTEGSNWALICGPYKGTDLRLAVKAGWFSEEETVRLHLRLGDKPQYAIVMLSEWIAQLNASWDAWEKFVNGENDETLQGSILADVEQIMREVRQVVPDSQTLENLLTKSRVE